MFGNEFTKSDNEPLNKTANKRYSHFQKMAHKKEYLTNCEKGSNHNSWVKKLPIYINDVINNVIK